MADDQQWRALTRVAELQGAAISTGMEAEQRFLASDPEADQAYERYFDRARRYLSGVLDYNTHCADGMPVEPVALPLVNALLRRADLVAADGHRERGVAYRRTVMRLSARHLGPVAAADVRRSQAAQLADEGRFNEALLELDRAREVFLAADDTLRAAQTALDLAQLYEWLGDFDRALHAIAAVRDRMNPYLAEGPPSDAAVLAAVRQQVAAIGRGEPSDAGVAATALQRIAYELVGHEARIRLKQGDLAVADRELRQILAHYRGLGAGEAIEYHLAVIALRRGDDTAAGQVLDRITPAFEHGLFRPRRAALHLLRSDLDRQRGAAGDAIGQADRGLAILAEHPNSDLSWRLHLRRARALAAAGRTAEALDAFLSGASVADDLRKGSLGYRLDTTFLADKLPIFTEGTLVAAERRDGVAAARLIEFVKARALTATLSIPPSARGPRGADEAAFDAVSERLDALEYLEYAGTATVDTARERATLLVRRRELAERIRIADPRWRGLSAPIEFDVDAVLARLADGDRAALTLYLLGSEIVGVLLHDGRARVARMPLTEDTRDALRRYTENLQAWQPDEFLFDLSAETGVGFEALVPAELRAAALAATTLLVVPHGELHLLPWAGLTAGGRRLFEHTTVGTLPNLSSLTVLDGRTSVPGAVGLLGDPDYGALPRSPALPEAGRELAEVAALYPGRLLAEPMRGPDATVAGFWRLAGRADADQAVLHLTCHATLAAEEPLTSGLLLTDAKIDAAEVAMRRIRYPEVVLSACSTGWRPTEAETLRLTGDDALGLVVSFLEAGARFVLASIPPALDEAAYTFAVAWHRHRLGGASPLAAVRATQLELSQRSGLPPWSWVGITGHGAR